MHRLGVLLKSYGKDLHHAQRMIETFHRHNKDDLSLFIVVPDEDEQLFRPLVGKNTQLLLESEFVGYLVDEPLWDLRPGYINQEIIKLAFWERGLTENYFCADSELVFVRDFGYDDFMADEVTPFTVLVEDNELKVEPRYYEQHWEGRERHLRRIQELVGLEDRRLLTCHGHQVMSSDVMASLKKDFMEPRGWSYADLLRESPYEFSWYNFWLQKSQVIPIVQREPLVKTFHNRIQELEYAISGVTIVDIARAYVGVVANSNYADAYESGAVSDPPSKKLARYIPPDVLGKAIALQAIWALRRRLAHLRQALRRGQS